MKELIEAFNMLRLNNQGKELNKSELKEQLNKILKGKTSDVYITAYVNNNCIHRIEKGIYKFPSVPVHINNLERAFEYAKKKQNEYNRKSYSNKQTPEADIQKAINLLLSTGRYEIFELETIIKKTKITIE